MILIQPEGKALVTAAELARASTQEFGTHATSEAVSDRSIDMQVSLCLPGEPPYTIRHFSDDAMLSIDGTPEQNARTASWLRSILPAGIDVYAVDGSGSQHVRLHDGITAEGLASGWAEGLPPAP